MRNQKKNNINKNNKTNINLQRKLEILLDQSKYRDYFITINEGAESYENALDIVKELNTKLYALITHNKDVLVDAEGLTQPKKTHIHIVPGSLGLYKKENVF